MTDMAKKETNVWKETAAQTVSDASDGTTAVGKTMSENVAENIMENDEATPLTAPELFIDPITVPVTLSEAQTEDLCVPKDFVYECSCYPHTPDADFEVTAPDGCRANTWSYVDETLHDHNSLVFAISLRLDLKLRMENRRAEVFPAYEQRRKLRHEAFEAKRAEYRRTHPDAGKQPMKVTLTAPEPRI